MWQVNKLCTVSPDTVRIPWKGKCLSENCVHNGAHSDEVSFAVVAKLGLIKAK